MLIFLLILIFIRPFISSLAFPYANFIYSSILLIFLAIRFTYKGIPTIKIQLLKYPLILFSLALIISIAFSTDELNSLKEIYKYLTGLLLFFIVAALGYEDKIRVIHTIILTGFIISLLAIYQYFFGFQHVLEYLAKNNPPSSFTLDFYIQNKRVFFPFITPNTLGGYLAMIIPLTLTGKKNIGLFILVSFALLLTKSLGAFLSIFLGLGVYFYLQGRLEKKKVLFLFGLLVIIGSIFITRSITQRQHIQPIFSSAMRLNYWRDTLRIIKAYPFVGVGLGNFNLIQSRYAHNSYLQIWAEMGILGIISILWLIITGVKSVIKRINNASDRRQIICLFTANAVFLIHNFVDFTFFLPEVALIWWITLGLNILTEKHELNCCNSNL